MLIGHSMGGLHSWCLAARAPRSGDARWWSRTWRRTSGGRTTGPWEPWLHALPVEFASAEQVFDEFGPVAGQYFLEAFDRTATGWRLHGQPARWIEIAARVGDPGLLAAVAVGAACRRCCIEAGDSVTPPGQMRRMAELAGARDDLLHVPGAGHLVHDDAPERYRDAVEAFLAALPDSA